jgi:ABC-type dipeptide/oligopeptide/nickel transport system permease component
MLKVVIRNILYTILLPILPLFFGLVLSFHFFQLLLLLPGDPVMTYLAATGNPFPSGTEYNAAVQLLGFDQPLIVQFFRYLSELLSGDLGISVVLSQGESVTQSLTEGIPVSFNFTILPVVLGLITGILLGILSVKVRYKLVKIFFQILIILGISMPMFFVGMWFQYTLAFQLELFPAIKDPFLPACILFLLTLFLTTRQVRSNYLKKSEEKHILSNSLQIIINLSVLITSILLLEVVFGLNGFFRLCIDAIYHRDYWLCRVCVFILIVLPAIILFLSNIGCTIYNFISERNQSQIFTKIFGRSERMIEEGAQYTIDSDQKFKDFIVYRLKSPLTIIGIAVVIFTTIVAVFPQILTSLTLEQAMNIYPGSWDPPSATHPLGQTKFGRDVLALLAYGVSTSMRVCILPVLIGIAIGILFGYLSKVHRWVKGLVLGFMIILFIIPSVLVIMMFYGISGGNISVIIIMNIMAMYMIPWVTLIISKGNYSLKLTAKKLIVYFPLFMAFNILLFEAINFLGFSDPSLLVKLGTNISEARIHLYDAPWAFLWPGLAIYASVIGFLTLHYGLKEPIPLIINREPKF